MLDVSIIYNSPANSGRLQFLSPSYREDKRGLETWRVTGPRSRIQRRLESRLNSKAAQKSKPLPVQRTKAGTLAGRGQLQALPGGGAKPTGCESGAGPATATSREDVKSGRGKTAPAPQAPPVDHLAPPHAGAPLSKPRPHSGRAGSEGALPPVTLRLRGGRGRRGGARSRAACSRTSLGFGCVRPAARPLPPPPSPRSRFAGRRLRGAGAGPSRRRCCRDAAGVHRPPELPGPGARCGALL